MKYLRIIENYVAEIIPEFITIGCDVYPLQECYTQEFISELIPVSDEIEVEVNMEVKEDGTYGHFEIHRTEPISTDKETEIYQEVGLSRAEIDFDFDFRLSCLELGISL